MSIETTLQPRPAGEHVKLLPCDQCGRKHNRYRGSFIYQPCYELVDGREKLVGVLKLCTACSPFSALR